VIRRALAEAEDGSVTLVVIGDMSSMAALIVSGGDEISPLSGKELVATKLERTVVMGGRFFESWPMHIYADNKVGSKLVDWEWNIHGNIEAARTVCEEWVGELVFSSYEIGSYIHTMVGYNEKAPLTDPVRLAYDLRVGNQGRCSWDHTAVLDAVRPNTYWNYHEFGRVTVDDEGVTHWSKEEGGQHSYLLPRVDYEEIRRIIDGLVLPR
jgi:inosine-uridine nucleoside N-ribohydrolase